MQRLLPYLWLYKWRVLLALGFMVAAKAANVSVPLLLKDLVDTMTPADTTRRREDRSNSVRPANLSTVRATCPIS